MKNSVIELAKNGNVAVLADDAHNVVDMAQSVGVCACGGALIEREGQMYKVLYTEQDMPAWVSDVEVLLRDKWVVPSVAEIADICRALGICVNGGAIVECSDGEMRQGYYIE